MDSFFVKDHGDDKPSGGGGKGRSFGKTNENGKRRQTSELNGTKRSKSQHGSNNSGGRMANNRNGSTNGSTKGGRPNGTRPPKDNSYADKTGMGGIMEDDDSDDGGVEVEEDPYANETADEKRVRIAQNYLAALGGDQVDGSSSEDDDDEGADGIARRLRRDVMKGRGKYTKRIAAELRTMDAEELSSRVRSYRGHQLPVTCVALSGDDTTAFSGSKDGTVVRWDVETGARTRLPGARKASDPRAKHGHVGQVLALAVTSDGDYMATCGGGTKQVFLWDLRTNKVVQKFKGHRNLVTCLAFRHGSHQLFSGSRDRTLKLWDADQRSYVDTLFGHEAEVNAIDVLTRERAVTVGVDRTARLWKVVEESQLVFRGHSASIDCVKMISDDMYLAGSQDGGVSLWSNNKKKPIFVRQRAHGSTLAPEGVRDTVPPSPRWISSVAACSHTDLVASGSNDGMLRLWEVRPGGAVGQKNTCLMPALEIPMPGYVNGLAFSKEGRFLVAGVGQEHRLGRWERIPKVKNGIRIVPLRE
eukprot:TRINITY_DN3934_c0_g1_i2.p1 TRINITY_DN3934_c0_g1~~TRINITY_DN3934_c0_g1_i2.p1  ORF type:complete len:601 (+),score=116.18 TRINITY_DN3934_c0_g1_i2:219-1805(+)